MKSFTVFILLLFVHGLVGQEISAHDFPWLVSIQDKEKEGEGHVCSGSILSDTYVITDANCFSNDYKMFSIGAGIHDISDGTAEAEQTRMISEMTPHGGLALVRVSSPFNLTTKNVGKISLSNLTSFENGYLVTVGWDAFNRTDPLESAIDLQIITVQENTTCTQALSINSTLQICTNSTCFRDNGGPLIFKSNSTEPYELVAIASYGDNCTTAGLFTLIATHLDEILKIMDDSPSTTTTITTESPTTVNTVSSATNPLTTTSTSSQTATVGQTTTTQNNAIVIESKLFFVSTIYMLCNFI